jgi:hypothetical protein
MKSLIVTSAFVFGIATGVGLTFLCHKLSVGKVSGFTMEEAQGKIGRRVDLKESGLEGTSKIINTGTVAYIDEKCGRRYLVIDWDQLLPGMKHRITWIDPVTYKKAVVEHEP